MKIKNILVIDVEATCWENQKPSDSKGERNEIIEIGIARIEIGRGIVENRSILTFPPTCAISEFCTKLTTLDRDKINRSGISFDRAMEILKGYNKEPTIFASWGDYDRKAIDKNCRWNGITNPMSNMHLNVKALYGARYGETGGMADCAENMNIPFVGTLHRGVDDADMIAKILIKLIN